MTTKKIEVIDESVDSDGDGYITLRVNGFRFEFEIENHSYKNYDEDEYIESKNKAVAYISCLMYMMKVLES